MGQSATKNKKDMQGARWIWPAAAETGVNQHVEFWQLFSLSALPKGPVLLSIAADSDYVAYVNGHLAGFGQFMGYPSDKTADTLDVSAFLREGENALAVLVQYQGKTNFSHLSGPAGLVFLLEADGQTLCASGAETLCRRSKAYCNGPIYNTTPQLSFSFAYDANGDDGWRENAFRPDLSGWQSAVCLPESAEHAAFLRPRPLPKLVLGRTVDGTVISTGRLLRFPPASGQDTPALAMQTDFLSPDCKDGPRALAVPQGAMAGRYWIVDLGREEAGYLSFEINAPAGTQIDIAHSEHLDDLRVRAYVGGRHFAFTYQSKGGRQRFTHLLRRVGGRYLALHMLTDDPEAAVYSLGLAPAEYPLAEQGAFSADPLHTKIYETGVRTLRLCMHEHYEDTPWREQALYAMDSRNQALCGYYAFGEYDFPAVSFDLLGKSLRPEGYLELTAPSQYEFTIPSFSLAYILELYEHYLYSGRPDFVPLLPVVEAILEGFAQKCENGLTKTSFTEVEWNFYEWAPGLSGGNRQEHIQNPPVRFDAPLNAFYHLGLTLGAKLFAAAGQEKTAQKFLSRAGAVQSAFHSAFWNEAEQTYQTYTGPAEAPHFAELTQALALYTGLCPAEKTAALRARLADRDNGLVRLTLSYSIFKYEALLADAAAYAKTVFDEVAADWGHMLYQGATSFWETIAGAADFGGAGSLCHGWSAIPVYLYHAYILGVKPTLPGFIDFAALPLSVLGEAAGTVPTPRGNITVVLPKDGKSPSVTGPV